MDIIRWSMNRPVSVTVGVLLVVLFGLIGVGAIPIQLTPTVDPPIITVSTSWPGRSPEEIVDQITKEQEERLKNVRGLKRMRSISREGAVDITLEFYIEKDIQAALQDVSDSLRQVPEYPEDVDEPIIKAAEGSSENAIAWIIIDLDPAKAARHPNFDITTLFDAADQEIRPYLERIDGVAEVNIFGGREREVRVLIDPTRLAQRRLTYGDVIEALRRENRNISAGSVAEGKRDYRVRVLGQFENAEDVLNTVVAYRDGMPVFVRDIGTAEIGHQKLRGFVRTMGHPALAVRVLRQSGANVMTVMEDVRARLEEVRTDILPRLDPVAGPDLRITQVYDETTYIDAAIELVLGNLWIGGLLAASALLLFLRSLKTTLIIALAIPISIIGTFLVLLAAGRTLNVISLAGLAFATGMVVDNAVVVLENIDRRRNLGDPPMMAVYRGAREVWGAIVAGTLTTVAVFVPILTIQDEVGQLFFDLTLSMAVSVSLSLLVAITVVPSAAAILLRMGARRGERVKPGVVKNLFGLVPVAAAGTRALSRGVYWLMSGWRGWSVRPALIILMTVLSIWGSYRLMPPLDYLPAGNRNLVFGMLLVPPGLSIEQQQNYAERIETKVGPYLLSALDGDKSRASSLPPIGRFPGAPPGVTYDPVAVKNFFIGAFNGGLFAGAISAEEQVVIPVGALLTNSMNGMPDAFGGARQASIFGMGVGGGNTVDIEISGPDLKRVTAAAGMIFGLAMQTEGYGPGSVQTDPSNFNLLQQETRLVLNQQGRQLGLRTEDLGVAARALVDGAFVGDFELGGRNVDMVVLPVGGKMEFTQDLLDVPVVTPTGQVVPIRSVADVVPGLAPQQILRIEELPAVAVKLNPPRNIPLGEAMERIETDLIGPARAAGVIDASMRVRLEGTAAKLTDVQRALFGASADSGPPERWQRLLGAAAMGIAGIGLLGMVYGIVRGVHRRRRDFGYGAVGLLVLGLVVGGLLFSVAVSPHLLTARIIWALLVTYLLMAALFESFLYPAVIMFSVPLATVGGFAALRLVHNWTAGIPTLPAQQLDVLTMIGFVILIGTVVNNAILLVEQALTFMKPGHGMAEGTEPAMPPLTAIAESVRTRVRPIFMTTLTTLGGGLPLVIAPGSGSEMYRGLGAVVVGGLFCSTVFTLVLVPLAFSLVLQMRDGVRALLSRPAPVAATGQPVRPLAPEHRREPEPVMAK